MKTYIFKCFVPVGSAEVDGVVKGGVCGGVAGARRVLCPLQMPTGCI